MSRHDDYLFDPNAPPDEDLVVLERALRGYAHSGRPWRRPPAWRRPWVLVAAVAATVLAAWLLWPAGGDDVDASAPQLVRVADGRVLPHGTWFETGADEVVALSGDVGVLTVRKGSRWKVSTLSTDLARLYLQRGEMEAFVRADVRPRFFQVDTPVTRAVDLGCRYVLTVDDDSATRIEVTLEQVAFESETREVFVPRRAVCVATRARGPGTPRFLDADPTFVALVDAFDGVAVDDVDARYVRGEALARGAVTPRDTLPLWHLLQERDPRIVACAEAELIRLVGMPEGAGAGTKSAERPTLAQWKVHLDTFWW